MKQEQSPFAALSPQEQKEQWICWQAAHQREAAAPEALPDLRLPQAERHELPPAPPVRHSQYDAVVRRMKQARRCAQGDQPWG